MNYYNEYDRNAAEWLRQLIAENLIPDGVVDERSITDVRATDLMGFNQCHFFAGIGGWSRALQFAGTNPEERLWTGSCPCPPFSSAGKKQECPECGKRHAMPHPLKTGFFVCVECGYEWFADERHLWPEFFRLIKECKPSKVFGEQVAPKDGRIWFSGVRATLEAVGYAVGGSDLCAAGINAPHIRQRIFWGAYRESHQLEDSSWLGRRGRDNGNIARQDRKVQTEGLCRAVGYPDSRLFGQEIGQEQAEGMFEHSETDWIPNTKSRSGRIRQNQDSKKEHRRSRFGKPCPSPQMGNTASNKQLRNTNGQNRTGIKNRRSSRLSWLSNGISIGQSRKCRERKNGTTEYSKENSPSSLSPWSEYGLVYCRDEKIRRVPAESILLGLVDGISEGMDTSGNKGVFEPEKAFPLCEKVEGNTMLLKGYGNAIVSQVAAEFIMSFNEAIKEI